MPDDLSERQSRLAIQLYTTFRAELDTIPLGGRFMPYRWWSLPDPIGVHWMPYAEMLGEFATELANIVNRLTNHVHRLRAWASVVESLTIDEKLAATHDFIDELGTVGLCLPYAIKSRFAYAVAHLCHQANMTKGLADWRDDDFPEEHALYLNEIEPVCRAWRRFRRFKMCMEPIGGRSFNSGSSDFRHAYNHRVPSRLVLGMTSMVTRTRQSDGRIRYGFGGEAPLELPAIAALLEIERDHCYRAFDAFQALVHEHIDAIAAFDHEAGRG